MLRTILFRHPFWTWKDTNTLVRGTTIINFQRHTEPFFSLFVVTGAPDIIVHKLCNPKLNAIEDIFLLIFVRQAWIVTPSIFVFCFWSFINITRNFNGHGQWSCRSNKKINGDKKEQGATLYSLLQNEWKFSSVPEFSCFIISVKWPA